MNIDVNDPTDQRTVEVLGGGRPTSRRQFVGGVAVLAASAVIAACGSDDTGDSASTSTLAPTATQTTEVPATTASASSTSGEPTATTAASATTEPATTAVLPTGTATVTHDFGTFEIPLQPMRVIAMENRRDLETAVVLGLPLAGVGVYGANPNVAAPFVPVDLAGVEILDNSTVNIEAILALQPDLILSRTIYLDDSAAALAEVAPFLPIASDGSWRADLEQVAGWLQREATLASALDQYDALLAEVGDRHADVLASTPVAIVEWYAADSTFYAGGLDDFQLQANTLAELGGTLVPYLTGRSYFDEPFSIENIAEITDAGAILLVVSAEDQREQLEANPLWQQLPAVAAGRVVVTDTRTNQGSVFAATECLRLLDELYTTLD